MLCFDKLETLERLRDFGFLVADPLGLGPSVIVAIVLYFFNKVNFSSRYVIAASKYLLQLGRSP